jgi:RsmE family RNA methyltransferase
MGLTGKVEGAQVAPSNGFRRIKVNIILFNEEEIQDNNVLLKDARAEHIVKVLRAEVGDSVRMGQIGGRLGRGTILVLKKKYPFEALLAVELTEEPPAQPALDLILALPRPIMLKRILSQATALGVGTFHIIQSRRVEKSFWESNLLDPEEYVLHLRQGLEQAAVDTRLPDVIFHRRFKPFIEDFWSQQKGKHTLQLIAHPSGEKTLADLISGEQGRIALAIGPEGGWIDFEVDLFRAAGFCCCTMGNRILKVDTAVVALLGAVNALRESGAS